MTKVISRKTHYGWTCESHIPSNTGKTWHVHTSKRSNGTIVSTAKLVTVNTSGQMIITQYDHNTSTIELASTSGNATQKKVEEVHAKGLDVFPDKVAHIESAPAPKTPHVGSILKVLGVGEENPLVVYEIDPNTFGRFDVFYKCVDLVTYDLVTQTHVEPLSQRKGQTIGCYWIEGLEYGEDTDPPLESLVYMAETKRRLKIEQFNQQIEIKKQKIAEGKELVSIPENATHVIVGILAESENDSMSDYYGHKIVKKLYLAWSYTKRDSFSEMRKAADNSEFTNHLTAPDSEEHREKYSMGHGYYLGTYKNNSGWRIEKASLSESTLEDLYLSKVDNRYFIPEKAETKPIVSQPTVKKDVFISQYSEKAGVVYGNTKPYKELLSGLNMRFNPRLTIGGEQMAGWIFPLKNKDTVIQDLSEIAELA